MPPEQNILEAIANKLLVDPALPEKENFVVQIIKKIAEELYFDDGMLVFGGGTCLSCGYGIIKRFSEDIDFIFVTNATRSHTGMARKKIINFIHSLKGFSIVDEPKNDSHRLAFNLDYSKNPNFTNRTSLREFIKIEFYFPEHKLFFDPVMKPVTSLYDRFTGILAETRINCIDLREITIDKISAMLWRIASENFKPTDLRHLHDLAILSNKINIDDNFIKIMHQVYDLDRKNRIKSIGQSFEIIASNTIDKLSNNPCYSADYNKFVDAMSYARDNESISFENALLKFKKLLFKLMQ
ncbi:MAG: nucleotidyl transferase AbiEii/AbiGii toxin family protein [Rickettsiales bacterium]|jgi:predicted nucleotidyltransferase component of viral defense system|nr:nucleotidyl transferase AbiEii/AbiGii toxin family protein [Rickettsiales bacterium]